MLVLKSFHEHLVKPLNYLLTFSLFVILPVERVLVICRITFYAICCPVLRNFFHIIGEQRNLRNNKKKRRWSMKCVIYLSFKQTYIF